MQLPYFFEPEIIEPSKTFTLSEETAKHCVQVLRMKKGEQLLLTNGKGLSATATIMPTGKKKSEVIIENFEKFPAPERKISIGASLLKNTGRFEWFLEKATEIGISEIIPLICVNTERTHFRHDRMQNILISAMLQSRQVWLPVLHEPAAFQDVVRNTTAAQKLIAHCYNSAKTPLSRLLLQNDILLLTGPEGDFSLNEINRAMENSFAPVSLGNTRLRSETANIVAVVMLNN
ncbi:MAG: 16S rRNA (uracil(1498)-N(3))-methyltransferase [Chitinophagaceae bacterium]|jgi:16S rRNA (uracil1498-N3)-methyltransferase|nr:16S rRNA (uracil(1498)-N(3))-methyltransferase [Chitinophagaceae bacterium]